MIQEQNITAKILDNLKEAQSKNMTLAFVYVRISSDKQEDGKSIEYQGKKATEYAATQNIFIVHVFSVTESAKKENRTEFNRMLKLCDQHKIKNLVFKSLDRMTRNLIDFATIEKKIINNDLIIHFFQDHKIYNEDINHNDKFELGIQALLGKFWSDKISNDIRKGNLFKAQNGVAPGRSPYGYSYDLEKKIHFINREVEQDLRFIFDEFDKGKYSILDFAELLNTKGIKTGTGRKWTKGNLHTLLINPFYHGAFSYKDKIWQGTHEPYYSKQRYEARMKTFGIKFLGQKKRDCEFAFAKFLKCSCCGKILIGEIKKGKDIYYSTRLPG